VRARKSDSILTWISVILLITAIIILFYMLIGFSRSRTTYPSNMDIAGVPVGGFNRDQAAQRLLEAYNLPIELHYNDAVIHLDPAVINFQLNLESMLATADYVRIGGQFWNEFWDYLWATPNPEAVIPLDASYSEQLLRSYLTDDISARYDQPAIPAQPRVGSVSFIPGIPGSTIDLDRAVVQIERALFSPINRVVALSLETSSPPRPSFNNLEILLKQILDTANYDGTAGIYLMDLQTSQEIHFVYNNGTDYPTEPDLAFSASSIIKIPIMVSAYTRLGENPHPEALNLLEGMIVESGNDPADWLMEQFIDQTRGPLLVTEDIHLLGLENTYLAGYFRPGSPQLASYITPAQSRTDLYTEPDSYNQTTTSDIGMLLTDLYQCSEYGGGALLAVFPDSLTSQECKDMIELLTLNGLPILIRSGAPEGTRIAQKFGWVSDAVGAIKTIGDAAIVNSPSGDYVLVIYFYHPVQLVWEPMNGLFGDLSEAVYNYYTISQ
jgi:beta-lactamase class A